MGCLDAGAVPWALEQRRRMVRVCCGHIGRLGLVSARAGLPPL